MHLGQKLYFDAQHPNGVYQRVMDKLDAVSAIYCHPEQYDANTLEHHTSVALREMALEEVRKTHFPQYPSRMHCLYVSATQEEAERWGEFFARIGRPTYSVVKLLAKGNIFTGDAVNCFDGQTTHEENLRLAHLYWENAERDDHSPPVWEMLADGELTVVEMIKVINANIPA